MAAPKPGDERARPRAYKSNLTKEQIRLLVEAIEMEGPEMHTENDLRTDSFLKSQARLWFESWIVSKLERVLYREAL